MIQNKGKWSLFLDRDGVINVRLPGDYISEYKDFEFKKDFLDVIPAIAGKFRHIFVVTNQQGIGKGLMTEKQLEKLHQQMLSELNKLSVIIDKVYFCPHLESENCGCRKPAPGMAYMAKSDYPDVDFEKSLLIGDSKSDIAFGKAAGMKTILVRGKNESANADYIVRDFYEIKQIISGVIN